MATNKPIPFNFASEAAKLVWTVRREQTTDIRARFMMIRIAEYIRQQDWHAGQADNRRKTLAQAKTKAAATRKHNADPFGLKEMRDLMAQVEVA